MFFYFKNFYLKCYYFYVYYFIFISFLIRTKMIHMSISIYFYNPYIHFHMHIRHQKYVRYGILEMTTYSYYNHKCFTSTKY